MPVPLLCARDLSRPRAPTTPCLSNLVNFPLDERLELLARRTAAIYTRYGDDLAFSWNTDRMPNYFRLEVAEVLQTAGYELQPCKAWRVSHISDRPRVTGLVLTGNRRLSIPLVVRWRMWYWPWKSLWSADAAALAKLIGYRGYVWMVK